MTGRATKPVAYRGMQTPWGRADRVQFYTESIAFVGTPSHGGIKVNRALNAKIPAIARAAGGWYEEDIAWAIPFTVFANEIAAGGNPELVLPWAAENASYQLFPAKFEKDKAQALGTLLNWMPEVYTTLTGLTPRTEDSMVLRERAAEAQAIAVGAFKVRSALGNPTIGTVDVLLERAEGSVPERIGPTLKIRMSSVDYDALRYAKPVAFPYLTPETVRLYPRID